MSSWVLLGSQILRGVCFCLLVSSPFSIAHALERPEPEARTGAVYRRALANNPATLDPAFVADIYSRTVVMQIAEGLVQFDAHLNPSPAIAEFWEASRDGRRWTFTLRQGVQFHHGREVTAQDFVYSFTRLLHSEARGPVTEFFRRIEGAEDFMVGKATRVRGLHAVDRYTLQITLTEAFAPSLTVLGLANAAVVPQEEVERLGDRFAHTPVGAGPFKFVRWEPGKEIVLAAHAHYYEGRPFLDTLVFNIGDTFEQTFAHFLAGNLEETIIPSSKTEEVRSHPKYRRYQELRKPTLGLLFIGFNTQRPPFNDRRVRQAFNYAVNKQAIVREITKMGSLPAQGALPPGMPGHDPTLQGYAYNPARAKELLAEAGYPQGAGFPVVHLWTVSKAESTKAELVAYQRDLAELGVRLDTHFIDDWTQYTDLLRRGELQMFRYAWYADVPDPDNFLFPLFHSSSPLNYTGYQNPQVDQWLEQARSTLDYAQRIALYREVERLIMDDAPWIPQHNHAFEYLYQPSVQGVELNLLGERWIPMKRIRLSDSHGPRATVRPTHVQTPR